MIETDKNARKHFKFESTRKQPKQILRFGAVGGKSGVHPVRGPHEGNGAHLGALGAIAVLFLGGS
jgi:hypothetical protein